MQDRTKNLISSIDAAQAVGISISTFNRFVEAGCLVVELENQGVTYFSRSQVGSLFGRSLFEGSPAEPAINSAGYLESRKYTVADTNQAPRDYAPLSKEEDVFDLDELSDNRVADTSLSLENPIEQPVSDPAPKSLREALLPNEAQLEEDRVRELLKVISFQDSLLTERETEIREVKNQCNWLKRRIEKLEERSEQGNLLLLAETYSIRRMLTTTQPKKPLLQAFLEAVGLAHKQSVVHTRNRDALARPSSISEASQQPTIGSDPQDLRVRSAAQR